MAETVNNITWRLLHTKLHIPKILPAAGQLPAAESECSISSNDH